MAYETDILDEMAAERRRPAYPSVVVDVGMTVGHRASGFAGRVVKWNAEAVTVQDDGHQQRHFRWVDGGFVVGDRFVTLVRPSTTPSATTRLTASGSIAGDSGPRVAAASRIWVEGRHDAELLEAVWGDDLRELGIVVEPLHGADDLVAAIATFAPGPERRLGVLLDHLVPGSKESRLAARVDHADVLVVGHPFVDVWAAVRPHVIGLGAWPELPRGDRPWKEALCAELGVEFETFWPRLRGAIRTYADLAPELVGAVEQMIDFVSAAD
jgi:hypothetical protein